MTDNEFYDYLIDKYGNDFRNKFVGDDLDEYSKRVKWQVPLGLNQAYEVLGAHLIGILSK